MTLTDAQTSAPSLHDRAQMLLNEHQVTIWSRTDRLFAGLLLFEWLAAMVLAVWRTPWEWSGAERQVHPHVWAATVLAAAIIALPFYLALTRPGHKLTRHTIAIGQMLMSALLIHLGDGRIEMHFHVFGSLAFLAFYRDWRVLITASVVVAGDHLIRGMLLPQSVYGVLSASVWRTIEHAGWVVFEDVFLITACVQSVREMRGIAEQRAQLEQSHAEVEQKVIERTRELKAAQDDLVQAARSSGMAEIATSVLHNVGNVLNSVNVSASVAVDKIRQSEAPTLARVSEMMAQNGGNLGHYLTADDQGKHIPGYLAELAECLGQEQQMLLDELTSLSAGVDHISRIVAAQQSMAKATAVRTAVTPRDLLESALLMQSTALTRDVSVDRRYDDCPSVELDKHAVLQILVNLISNACQSLRSARENTPSAAPAMLELSVTMTASDTGACVRFAVVDNGVGIAREHLDRIFSHGFTTKKTGHGFGLHASANAARAMGGSLSVSSDGPGTGATFVLELPTGVTEVAE